MGGRGADVLPLAALIPLGDADSMIGMALAFQKNGISTFRLKLGTSIEFDRRVIAQAREALGPAARLRVDYSQAYTPSEAIRAIATIAPFGIDCADQPVRADDWIGMSRVHHAVPLPLMAHEGCFSLTDVTLIELGAVGVLGVNTERPVASRRPRAMTTPARMGTVPQSAARIASAAQVHLGAARASVLGTRWNCSDVMLEDDRSSSARLREQRCASDGPGLGVVSTSTPRSLRDGRARGDRALA